MSNQRRFRFGVQARKAGSAKDWLDLVQRTEALGYDTLSVYDHFVRGYDPMAALGAAASVTSTLRLGTLVIDTDFRHPGILAKGLATLDVMSNGRMEIGLGAGWLRDEYIQSGIPFDSPGTRIKRMAETAKFLREAFTTDPVTYKCEFFEIENLILPPKPVQLPSPPILIGGGGKRVLGVAARHADIVGLTSRSLPDGSKVPDDMTGPAIAEKIGWIKEAAGDRYSQLEITSFLNQILITDDRTAGINEIAERVGIQPDQVVTSPHIAVGSIDEIVEQISEFRRLYDISYFVIEEQQIEVFAPIVERMKGK